MKRRLAPTVALAALSPFVAEFLLGNHYLLGVPRAAQQIIMYVLYVLWYGMAAVLIREITRRTGHGWPTILLLGLAFAVIEEGLVTQSLFNPHYAGLDLLSYGYVGWLGTGSPWAVFVLALHVVWSIATPIALIEAIWPERAPWIGRVGLGVVVGLLLLGGAAIFAIGWFTSGFLASPGQLTGALVLAVIATVVAMWLPRGRTARPPGRLVGPALLTTAAASAFQLLHHTASSWLPAWASVLLSIGLFGLVVVVAQFRRMDVLGLALGPLLTYCWVGLGNAAAHGTGAVVEQSVLVVLALAVAAVAVIRHRAPAVTNATPSRRTETAANATGRAASGGA